MTQTTTPTSATAAAVDRYLSFWNADPGEEQQRLATAVFREDAGYHAPIGVRVGVDEIVQLGREFAEHLGDIAFRARTAPDVHHDRARLQWEIIRGDDVFAEGTDVLVIDERGLVESVTTFLDKAPEGFDADAY